MGVNPKAKDHGSSIAGQGRASQQKRATHVRFGSAADITRLLNSVRFTPESGQTGEGSTCPLCAKSGRTRLSKISYSITARSEVERTALKIGASAGRALSHRQRLRGLSLIQRISSNLNGLCLRHVLSNGKSSRRTLRCSE